MDFNSVLYIIIYISLWSIVLIIHQRFIKRIGLASIIITSYLFYSICSLFLFINLKEIHISDFVKADKILDLFPFLYLFSALLIFLNPVILFDRYNINKIHKPSSYIVNSFLMLFFVSNLLSLFKIIPRIQNGLTLILTTRYGGSELYAEAHNVEFTSGNLNILGFVNSSCSDIGILFIFYYLTYCKNKIYVISLFILIFISVLDPIARGLRTETIMKIFLIIVSYYMFHQFYSPSLNSKIKRIGIISVILISIPTIALSISRFGNSDGGTLGGTVSYIGQANLNFNNYCLDANGTRNGDRTCNMFKKMLGFENVPESIMETRAKYRYMKIDDGSFYTFIGDFVLDFGPTIAFIIIIIISISISRITICQNKTINFHQLLCIYFVVAISIQGGMYLFHYSFSGNWKIIVFILFYILMKMDYNNKRKHEYINIKSQ